MQTIGFTQLRSNLAAVTNQVIETGEEVTVFRRNQPVFKIVPLVPEIQRAVRVENQPSEDFMNSANDFIDRYESVFDRLAH